MVDNKYFGIYQGVVTSVKDPEKRGRIKIKCPDVLDADTDSAWCDPVVPVAFDGGGDFCLPAVKETVWVMFIGGDPNQPVWIGGWWSEKKTPLGKNYIGLGNIRIINYADCIITMREGVININVAEGDTELQIKEGRVTINGNLRVNGNITYTGSSYHVVE